MVLIELVAGGVALTAAWVLYGVLGKGLLGADDDFWNQIRRAVLPTLDRIASVAPGFYARSRNERASLACIVTGDVDSVERDLMAQDFTRNPVASLKTNPAGWTEDASWARRYKSPRWAGTRLRRWADGVGRIAWPLGVVGRLVQAVGDIVALRQVHATLYRDHDAPTARTLVYAHDEPNALNPLVAWRHYRGTDIDTHDGIRAVRKALRRADADLITPRRLPRDDDETS